MPALNLAGWIKKPYTSRILVERINEALDAQVEQPGH